MVDRGGGHVKGGGWVGVMWRGRWDRVEGDGGGGGRHVEGTIVEAFVVGGAWGGGIMGDDEWWCDQMSDQVCDQMCDQMCLTQTTLDPGP